MAPGTFRSDLGRFLDPAEPVALARFHDGEYHVLRGAPYDARSGWHVYRASWLRDRLYEALTADLDGYWVGISPPCDYPLGTAYYRSHVSTQRRTFATLFWHSNYRIFRSKVGDLSSFCVVGCTDRCEVRVPANGVAKAWNIDEVVDQLLEKRQPILVAAGPCACIIVHQYWLRAPAETRQTILDVGAAIDPRIHGRATRDFQKPGSRLASHSCRWDKSVPWSKAAERKLKGYRARLAGLKSKYGGKRKNK